MGMMRSVEPVDHNTAPVPTAVRLTVGVVQVSVAEVGLILSCGAFWSAEIDRLAEAEQPLLPVRVTE
jgi:hypothetical protein